MTKKFRSGLLAVILIMAMMAAGCGKGSTPSTDDTKPIEDTESVDEKNEAEESEDDSASQEQEEAEAETDSADDEQANSDDEAAVDETEQEDANSGDGTADSGELNEDGVPEDLMQELYDCVEEAVLTEYIEPNGIDPAEFEWPGDDVETHVYAWNYLASMYFNYLYTGSMYDTTNFGFEKPNDSVCQLMNSVFDGMVEWEHKVQKKVYKLAIANSPMSKLLPENIDFTD